MMHLVLSGKRNLQVQERKKRGNLELQVLLTGPLLQEYTTVHQEEVPVLVEGVQVPVGEDKSVLTEVLGALDEELRAQDPEGLPVQEED